MDSAFDATEFLACCGSTKFAKEMAVAARFANPQQTVEVARDIWFNKVDVNGWLEAFSAHPQIGQTSSASKSETSIQWSKGEQSTALATSTESSLQELFDWNARYRDKFGFVFLICASGRSTTEILNELKKRYSNRPIVEFEIAAQEQMKITELRLAKLFAAKTSTPSISKPPSDVATKAEGTTYLENVLAVSKPPSDVATKAEEGRMSVIGAHLTAASKSPESNPSQLPSRTRPPITTHILDVSRGSPAAGVEVQLEILNGSKEGSLWGGTDSGCWVFRGSSVTNTDGRSGHLMDIVDSVEPGIYRISFNTGKYSPDGFFPYVSIVFEIKESQRFEHFHVPLLLSPFSFTTYRGS